MKFTRAEKTKSYGTFYIGQVNCEFDYIVDLFGPPEEGDGEKVDFQWTMETEFETPVSKQTLVVTVYNYKNGPVYGGPDVTKGVHEWHIGCNRIVPGLIEKIVKYFQDNGE